jgi:hypothetical protein
MKKMTVVLGVLAVLCSGALADSISPATLNLNLAVGGSVTITKTVTVAAGAPTTSKADVFFLADTTGSMGTAIGSVISGASAILSGAAGLGDVAFGVGEYKDFGYGDPYAYRLNTDITTSQATAQAGINMWSADGGYDWEEANLYALQQVADTTSWRPGSARILVWFGDAPGHDPSGGVDLAGAISALNGQNIGVEAVDVGELDYYGQASAIATATGGHYYLGDSSSIVTVIQNAITTAFQEYNNVALGVSGAHPLVDVAITPGSYSGDYDRSDTRTFTFDVTYTCRGEGVDAFDINALVDGGIVAVEHDTITNTGNVIPEPMTMAGVLLGLGSLLGYLKKRSAA